MMLARYAAIAIGNARHVQALSGRRDELERTVAAMTATVEISRALAGETDLDVVLQLIAKRGRALVGAGALVIELAVGDRLRIAAVAGDVDRAIVGPRAADGEHGGRTRAAHAPVAAPERRAQPRALRRDGLGQFGFAAGAGLFVPLAFRTETPGVLAALHPPGDGEFSDEDERLLMSFATSAASAVVTARSISSDQLRAREAATEDERRRWARELHDETLQGLGALRLSLSAARKATDTDRWRAALEDAITELDTEIANLRGIISDVRPAALDELGTGAAVEALADRVRSRGIDVVAARRSRLRGRRARRAARAGAGDGGLPDRPGGDDERAQALGRGVGDGRHRGGGGARDPPRPRRRSGLRRVRAGRRLRARGHARARRAARRHADDRVGARRRHHAHRTAPRRRRAVAADAADSPASTTDGPRRSAASSSGRSPRRPPHAPSARSRVVVHPDHDERGVRRNPSQARERIQPGIAEHGMLDDDDGRRQPLEQPDQVREIGGRGQRHDPGLARQQLPDRGAHTLVACGDEDRDLWRVGLGG